ncbi:MAG: pyrimidine 5'-nucleotidase [Desulfuromonadaceae bacterium]|nr:pyrimidine 5'-nucleotidase [Desulfuromonadaceae bacterium]
MKALLFDLDNTLYSASRALFNLIDVRINRYMHEVVGIAHERVDQLRRHYWQQYGVTLRGLMQEHGTDPEHYLHYVHEIDVSSRLDADPTLRAMLQQLPQRKVVFTNGSAEHALRVLECLQIEDCFEQVFDIRVSGYLPKPCEPPYCAVLRCLALPAGDCVMIEDSLANLQTAARLGMRTIHVAEQDDVLSDAAVDARVCRVHQVAHVLQGWQSRAGLQGVA